MTMSLLLSMFVATFGLVQNNGNSGNEELSTFLVNFASGSPIVDTPTAVDFSFANPDVVPGTTVHELGSSSFNSNLSASNGDRFNVVIGNDGDGGLFATNTGTYENEPILDSYLFNRSTNEFRTVTVSSLEEIAEGATVTLVLYGVGDQPNQESEFRVVYNGVNLGLQEADYDGSIEDTFVFYSFVKVDGANQVELAFRNADNGSNAGGFNGFSLVVTGPSDVEAIRINAGGGQHIDAQGNLFLADRYFSGGSRESSTNDDIFIVGTGTNATNDSDVDDILYQTERFDTDLSYEIPVANGIYDVRLHFAEIFFTSENLRVFDVSIEGVNVLDDFDVFGTRFNAFTQGHDASLPLDFAEIEVTDGFLSLNLNSQGADGINNAKISAIEVLPVANPTVALLPTGGNTIVTEGGQTDSFSVVLTQPPVSNVTTQILPGNELSVDTQTFTFTPSNFDIPQSVTITAINDSDGEGQQSVSLQVVASSDDPVYDGVARTLSVTVIDDDLVPVSFQTRNLDSGFDNPVAGTFGPDGRLYVANQFGLIRAYTFDNDYNVIDTQDITAITDLADSGSTLGITFNPFEQVAPGETPTLYVSQSFLFRATTEFESNVLTLTGPNHSVVTEIITGLPVSGFDHGINGLQFDGEGNLLIGVGGNTNTGVFDGVFASDAPESPLTSAILRARIFDPNFNGDIEYEFIDPEDPDLIDMAQDLGLLGGNANSAAGVDPNNQLLGEFLKVRDVAGEVEVETFAVGLRNSYDIVYTTQGHVFATDNGPNGIAEDELNFVSEGDFLGHPSIPRGRLDPRQTLDNAEYDVNAPSTADYTAPLTEVESSVNGIDEYRAETFNGQLRGQLVAQRFNNEVFFFQLDQTGTQLTNINSFGGGQIADGLDILTGPGGVIFGIDRNQDRVTIAVPFDNSVVTTTAYDIFPFRAPAEGGNQFIIGGTNFGDMSNTMILIDGVAAELVSVESNRIVGVFPALASSTEFLDVEVISDGEVSIIEESFLPLGGAILGDFDRDGDVDIDDLDRYNRNLDLIVADNPDVADIDLDNNGVIDSADFEQHFRTLVETSNGGVGTEAGDINLDGVVDVLGDAFELVNNLGSTATSWSQGDLNADGVVDVLGDAFILIGSLGFDNGGVAAGE